MVSQYLDLIQEKARREEGRALRNYQPYPKQAEFHALGATFRERALMATNQIGKTFSCGAESAYHATGEYPDWWNGHRFTMPTIGWCSSETMEVSRDGMQRILLGRDGNRGTGAIPRDSIIDLSRYPNVPGAISVAKIKSKFGGISFIVFKSYDQGRRKFQSETLDWAWNDEEPPQDIYSEVLTRTNVKQGPVYSSFTPLKGATEVVMGFLKPADDQRDAKVMVNMTLDDAPHFTADQKRKIIASYPSYERDARTKGIPILGSGRIFPIDEETLKVGALAVPNHWPCLVGIDFGFEHPTAMVWTAFDREADTFYVYDAYRRSKELVPVHAITLKAKGDWIPVAWPHDGNNETAAGEALAKQYKGQGVKMLRSHATNEGGGNHTEPGLHEMMTYMQTGRFKVASHLADWFEEFRMYHRKDGKIVKERDDLMAATRYAFIMRRKAITKPVVDSFAGVEPTYARNSLTNI